MPYTEAVVLEALRISSVAPVGILHMATENARLSDYIIPKVSQYYLIFKNYPFLTVLKKEDVIDSLTYFFMFVPSELRHL